MKNLKGDISTIKKFATFYLKIADFKSAKAYLETMLANFEEEGTEDSILIAQLNLLLGRTYYNTAQYEKSNEHLSNALRIFLTDQDADAVESTEPLLYLGRVNMDTGERKKGINYM